MKKTLKIIGNILLWLFVAFTAIVMVCSIVSTVSKKKSGNGIPSLFGKATISIQSDSMKPAFDKGYMIFSDIVNSDTKIEVGDVITFFADLDGDGSNELNSHRIISIEKDADKVFYQTKGDKEGLPVDPYKVPLNDVVAVWHDGDTKIWGLGAVADFLQSPAGFGVVIVLPCAVFFIFELVILIKTIIENKQKKTAANDPTLLLVEEEIKRKAVEEYIKSQQAGASDKDVKEESPDTENKEK